MSDSNEEMFKQLVETLNQDNTMTQKQLQILEAAIKIISEKGYYNTSTSEIAKQAGVAEGTIFRHYRTKKDLLVAIVTPVVTNISAPFFAEQFVDQAFSKSYQTFEEFLYAFVENRFEFVKTNVPLLKIVLQELSFHPEIQAAYKRAFTEKVHPAMCEVLNHYKKRGDLKDIPNQTMIRMAVPSIIGFLITRFIIQPNAEWNDEQEIKQTIDYIMNGIGK
ncbi:TetR/AcrR family transcriptional regulator [Virgibacillus sp. C22-A2]|uniref:TetR/AcrR family transcriptional regulator n=1 Tax=Virgibacillus tibetensis TaxID=3042313 RepID=A0ABU6KH69_9BACI|nr:TetR/AcrR family transcriptional regulator [Virgibacillus sp. C22-A2]